jgi:leucyl/phenylalanyl-tRNA--protein transferase
MPIYRLTEELIFPYPEDASEEGILAIGGDLSPERLILAYSNGIFPWFNEGDPIIWWSPKNRCVLYPKDLRVSKSMKKLIRKNIYSVTFDKNFKEIINKCSSVRKETGTWITEEMIEAYNSLHKHGYAHSVEVWHEGEIVGGLYGISLGKFFFGESMFSLKANASKFALIELSKRADSLGFIFIDCQMYTEHLGSLGAIEIPRRDYLDTLVTGLVSETIRGSWS